MESEYEMEKKILNIINRILVGNGNENLSDFDPKLSLRELGFDSLMLAELTVRIEDEFEVDIFENGIVDKLAELFERISRGK